MVGWRAARAVLQGRQVHPKVGTELGHPALSLGRDAIEKSGLVALAGARGAKNLSRFPHRSRSRILSHLRVSLAANAEQGIPSIVTGRNAGADGRCFAAILSTR